MNNRDEIIAKTYEYKKTRLSNDPLFKFRETFSSTFRRYVMGVYKDKSCFEILKEVLGYDLDQLIKSFEMQFEEWMNWENHGNYRPEEWDDDDSSTCKWQIDHIIPHSEFQYLSYHDEDFKKCWDLNNLRPYSAKQNLIDGSRRTRHSK